MFLRRVAEHRLRTDRKRGAVQHAEGGVAQRVDALGMQVVVQHAAKDLANLVEGKSPLPDDHCIPRPAVAGREIGWFAQWQKSRWRIRKDMPTLALMRFFPESSPRPTDSFMSRGK